MNLFNIELLTQTDLEESRLTRLFDLQESLTTKYNFLRRIRTKEKFRSSLPQNKEDKSSVYLLSTGNAYLGFIYVNLNKDWSQKDEYQLKVCHLVKNEIESFETYIRTFITTFIKNSALQVSLFAYNGEFADIIAGFRGKCQERSKMYTLKKSEMDSELFSSWVQEAKELNSDLRLKIYNGIPDQLLAEYCALFNETMVDMPDNDEDGFIEYVATPDQYKVNNWRKEVGHHCCVIYNEQNEMVAKSNVSVHKDYSYQFMIGVKRDFRGRKLGKWLYGAMYDYMLKNCEFEALYVHHHFNNLAAYSLSEKAGYEYHHLQGKYTIKEV